MQPGLVWDESFSVGVAAMDHQHQRILELIHELRGRIEGGQDWPGLEDVLNSLTRYVEVHFREEEALLAQHQYPDLIDQKREHRAFARSVGAQCLESMHGQDRLPLAEVLTFLEAWWRHHVLEVDMAYRPFLEARGVR